MAETQRQLIPKQEIQKYIDAHHDYFLSKQLQHQQEAISDEELEVSLSTNLFKIYATIIQIFRDNNINPQIEQNYNLPIEKLMEQIEKIHELCEKIKKDTEGVPQELKKLKDSLQQDFGARFQVHIERVVQEVQTLLHQVKAPFTEINKNLQSLLTKFDANATYLQQMNEENKQKDIQIEQLSFIKGQFDVLNQEVDEYKRQAEEYMLASKNLSEQLKNREQNNEEEKKNEDNPDQAGSKRSHLPCFDLPDFSQILCDGKLQFKKGPYKNEQGTILEVEGEWLNGVPHGVCIVDSDEARGVVTFTQGKQHGGPQWLEYKQSGARLSIEYNNNGKASGFQRAYQDEGSKSRINGFPQQVDTPGWIKYIIQSSDQGQQQQPKIIKTFFKSGEIIEGKANFKSKKVNGHRWAPKNDGTYDKYEVEQYGFQEKMVQENFPEQLFNHIQGLAEDDVDIRGDAKQKLIDNVKLQ